MGQFFLFSTPLSRKSSNFLESSVSEPVVFCPPSARALVWTCLWLSWLGQDWGSFAAGTQCAEAGDAAGWIWFVCPPSKLKLKLDPTCGSVGRLGLWGWTPHDWLGAVLAVVNSHSWEAASISWKWISSCEGGLLRSQMPLRLPPLCMGPLPLWSPLPSDDTARKPSPRPWTSQPAEPWAK